MSRTMPIIGALFLGTTALLLMTSASRGDDVYRPSPREAYQPSVYCQWNRTGLPAAQQQICLDLDKKNPPRVYHPKPGEEVTTLLPSCEPGGAISCNDDLFQKVWLRIEAANGEVTKVDMNSIQHSNLGSAMVVVYTYVPNANSMFDPTRLRRLLFDCADHFQDITGGSSALLDAPPRSVAGRVAALACAEGEGAGLTSAGYCVDFSPSECDRIKKVVEAKTLPAFCDDVLLTVEGLSRWPK